MWDSPNLCPWQVQEPPGAAPPPARGREAPAAAAGLRRPDPRAAAAAPAPADAATTTAGVQPGPVLSEGCIGAAAAEALPDSKRGRGGYLLPLKGDII